MSDFRKSLEIKFENFAHLICKHRIKTLVFILIFVIATSFQIPKMITDLSMEVLLRKSDPTLLDYNTFRDQFGRDAFIVVAVKHPDIFNLKFLKKLKALHEELEEKVPYVDEVTSLINARNTLGEGDELIVEDLFENWPANEGELAGIKKRAMSNPLYRNLLFSEDSGFATIIIKTNCYSSNGQGEDEFEGFEEVAADKELQYLTDEENREAVMAVSKVTDRYKGDNFTVYVAGSPAIVHFLAREMFQDIKQFMIFASITIVVFLFIMFRRISGVLLPLAVVILSVSSSMGIMAAAGIPLTVPTQIIPSFLIAVGVGSSVHILSVFYQRLRRTDDREGAIAYAMGHSGLPVVMTNITTGCGLLSFVTADVAPIAHLGKFASIGVMVALVYTLLMLPALLSLLPIKSRGSNDDPEKTSIMDRFLTGISNFSTGHPYFILIVSGIIVSFSAYSALQMRFSHDPLGWLPETNPARIATEIVDHEMRGSLSMEVVIDTGKENGIYDPDLLNRLEKAETVIEAFSYEDVFVGKVISVAAILKEINQALNENRPEYYNLPQNRDLIAQEFLLFENSGSDDLEDYVDSQFSKTRITIKIPFKDTNKYTKLMTSVKAYFCKEFPDEQITVTGIIALLAKTMHNTMTSMGESYLIAFIVISILMVFLIGGFRIGLFSMIPNCAPILMMLCLMHILSLPMDLFAMMVGSIAMGLAVDDTIHFMHNFRSYYRESGDPVYAVHETLQTTGRAMLVTTIVLSLGFFIYMFASLKNLYNFGLLTGFTIIMALLADYFLAPALMVLVNKKKS